MTDSRLDTVLQAAMGRIQAAVSAAVDKTASQLGLLATSANSNAQRQLLMTAEFELQNKTAAFNQAFSSAFRQRAGKDVRRQAGAGIAYAETDWDALTLVDNAEVERNVVAERLARSLADDCESEFKTLHDFLSPLLADDLVDHNPLRAQLLSSALMDALAEVSPDLEVASMLAKHIGRHLGPDLRECYQQTISDLRARGIQPSAAAGKARAARSSTVSPASTLSGAQTQPAPLPDTAPRSSMEAHQRAARALGEMFGMSLPASGFHSTQPGTTGSMSFPGPLDAIGAPVGVAGGPGSFAMASASAVGEFTSLIRRLNSIPSLQGWSTEPGAASDFLGTHPGQLPAGSLEGTAGGGFAGPMMAKNMIRAHREELVRASGGAALDQMVIDIVAALFDQVLSDPKVSPQMARQIARLQLPVLRVALQDMGFFNSRKHPVRRFVNRIATLSATFDEPDQGAGAACLARVTALINEVVEGDFDQMEVYASKLAELEAFVEDQSRQESAESAAVAALLSGKEADLRVQQRYMQVLKRELATVDMPEFVRDFLTQIWSQVQVMASARDGAQSPLAQRVRKAGRELALSVQPKGSPQLRKDFLIKLPQLMKDLTEGLALIQWSEDAKQDFFSKLLPAHAESLKTQPHHDLTQRLLEQQLNKVEKIDIPSREDAANDPLPVALDDIKAEPLLTVVTALSAEEIKQAGFIPEAALLTEEPLDIDLDLAGGDAMQDIDINLDSPPVPSAGMQLVHHIIKGTAYQMQMQGQWKRVRLTWVSEGRTFFIFTQGQQHKQTISLTSRTLAKMCDTGRFKAFEPAELIERATMRARRQLAAMSKTASVA